MTEMLCIVCPRGCHLSVGDAPDFPVSGNFCPRGERYGREEMIAPMRTVTATCPLKRTLAIGASLESAHAGAAHADSPVAAPGSSGKGVSGKGVSAGERLSSPRRVPVRTTGPVPCEKVGELVSLLLRTGVPLPVHEGDVIIDNWENGGISVIATRTVL